MRISWIITRYIAGAVVPYFIFSWLLLSVILFVQQASRFSDIFFGINIPPSLVWQLAAALIPNVIAFTCPMAVLVGVIIGLSKMQGDNELIAIRAAGVGSPSIMLPVVVLGLALSAFAFLVNIFGVPAAASVVRAVAIRAAIYKLESPIEPGLFNTEVAGLTIYVNKGDLETGEWQNIFIHSKDASDNSVRLITSSNGRIDSNDEVSELVLANARSIQLRDEPGTGPIVSERIGEIRFAIQTRRGELIERLSVTEVTPEELGLGELARYASGQTGKEKTEAEILFQRRIVLSVTPLIFCVLGASLVLRFNRGGRGFGAFLAVASLIGFYLLAFLGEQLARTGRLSVLVSAAVPLGASIAVIIWFNWGSRYFRFGGIFERLADRIPSFGHKAEKVDRRNYLMDLTTGLRDFDLAINLAKHFVGTVIFLASIFLIFTAFELWRFAGSREGGIGMLGLYLLYLLPFIYLQLAPSAAMIALLVTYTIKSRQNEIVTWTAAGQSVYRLLVPAFILMFCLGLLNWQIEERVAAGANIVQETVRSDLRNTGSARTQSGVNWVATRDRLISFERIISASDNEKAEDIRCDPACQLRNVSIYEFDKERQGLQTLYRIPAAYWNDGKLTAAAAGQVFQITENNVAMKELPAGEAIESPDLFIRERKKPNQLTIVETRERVQNTSSEVERRMFAVSLEKKYVTLILPFVVALFTAPFAISLGRKGKVASVGYAVGLWLVFMGVTAAFEQFGINGAIAPWIAVWAPMLIFTAAGLFLLSRVRT